LRSLIRLDRIDITLAWLVCILAAPVTVYIYAKFNPLFITVGIVVFVVALGYLLARRGTAPRLHNADHRPKLHRWLNMAFFGLFAYSVAAYLFRPELYVRPLGYYVAIALMAVVLFVEFAFVKSAPTGLGLFKVVMVSASLVWTESLLYSGVLGVDPWYHQWVYESILETGHTPEGITYSGQPGMHYIIAGTSLVTGLGYKMAALVSISTIQIMCNPVFAYLIGRTLYNEKVGLVAALMVGVASWHIMFSYWIIPNGFAMSLILPIVYVVLRLSREWAWWLAGVGVVLGGVVIVTHPIASVMLVLALLFIWFSLWAYGLIGKGMVPSRYFLAFGGVFAVATLLYWLFISDNMSLLVGLFRSGFSYEYWGTPVPGVSVSVGGVGEQLFNYMGMFLFFALAIMGCFVAFSKRLLTQQRSAYILAGLLVLVVTFLGFILQGVIIVGRWCYLAQIMLAVSLGIALIWMTGHSLKRAAPVSLLVFCLVFMMIMSPQANMDNLTFGPNTIVRSAFTRVEVEAMGEAVSLWGGEIAVDAVYYSMRHKFPDRLVDMSECLASANFAECEDMLVLVREDIVNNPCRIGEISPCWLAYDPGEELESQGFVEAYDWGEVSGFVSK